MFSSLTHACCLAAALSAAGAEQLPQVYAPWTAERAQAAALEWVESRNDYDPAIRQIIDPLWISPADGPGKSAAEVHDAVMQTFYATDPQVRQLVDACAALAAPPDLADFPALHTSGDFPFYANNVRAFYARYLAVTRSYDEALGVFGELDLNFVVDPASALFYKAVCEHALLQKEEGLQTISSLLESTEGVPVRYATVAGLMRHHLEELREKSLAEVSQQMRDVERRLALGQAGQRVQRVEERIIVTLDEIIEKIEQQQGGGGGSGGAQGERPAEQPPSNPADESYVGGVKGPGEVEPKNIGHDSGWGNLPEKEQAEVKNMLDKQFPSHYRQAVTEYLRKLGRRPAPGR